MNRTAVYQLIPREPVLLTTFGQVDRSPDTVEAEVAIKRLDHEHLLHYLDYIEGRFARKNRSETG